VAVVYGKERVKGIAYGERLLTGFATFAAIVTAFFIDSILVWSAAAAAMVALHCA
jgi:hypothetical protein